MKQYTVFVCENCGYESKYYDDMRQHEAAHLGLTVEQMDSYIALKNRVSYMSSLVTNRNNEETRSKFDEAVERLVAFEQEHGIKA